MSTNWPVDLMESGGGWYSCANWCGREVRYRNVFCPFCAWMDGYICIDRKITLSQGDWDNLWEEMSGEYRGVEIEPPLPPETVAQFELAD